MTEPHSWVKHRRESPLNFHGKNREKPLKIENLHYWMPQESVKISSLYLDDLAAGSRKPLEGWLVA